jgi:hypothetical protein
MFAPPLTTRLWSPTQLILRDFVSPVSIDDKISGGFTFEERGIDGYFEAKVSRIDAARKMIGAQFTWLNPSGQSLLEQNNEILEAAAPQQTRTLRVTLMHSTINWSLTGLLASQYFTDHSPGHQMRGLIRIAKSEDIGAFTASVIRVNMERHTLALKFGPLPSDTFALLENAMKKSA